MPLLMLSSLLILSSTYEPCHIITFLKENQKPHDTLFSMIVISCSVVACWIFLNLVLYLKTKFKK